MVVAIVPPNTTINGYTHKTWKLQVRIAALHQNIADSQLPFFTISRQLFRGASANVGNYSIPRVGSKVEVRFDAGSSESGYVCSELLDGSVLTTNEYLPNSSGQNQDNYGWIDEHGNYNAVISNASYIGKYVNQYTLNVVNHIQVNGDSTITIKGKDLITIDSDTRIILQRGSSQIIIDDSGITINGNTVINGTLNVSGLVTGGTVVLQEHTHPGVTSGGNNTLPPNP